MPTSGDQQDTRGSSGLAGVLRNPFRLNRSQPTTAGTSVQGHASRLSVSRPEYYGGPPNNDQLFAQLKPGNPIPDRINAANAVRQIVAEYALSSIIEIWSAAQDMLNSEFPSEARQAALKLLTAC